MHSPYNRDSLFTIQSTYNTDRRSTYSADTLFTIQIAYLQYSLLLSTDSLLQYGLLTIQTVYVQYRQSMCRLGTVWRWVLWQQQCRQSVDNTDSLLTIQTVYSQYSLCVDLKQFDSRCCDNSNADSFILTIIIDSLRVVKRKVSAVFISLRTKNDIS